MGKILVSIKLDKRDREIVQSMREQGIPFSGFVREQIRAYSTGQTFSEVRPNGSK